MRIFIFFAGPICKKVKAVTAAQKKSRPTSTKKSQSRSTSNICDGLAVLKKSKGLFSFIIIWETQ